MKLRLACGRFAIVDSNIYNLLMQRTWSIKPHGKTFYAKTNGFRSKKEQATQYLHWFVVGKPIDGLEVDHIDGNGLNNRRTNLRLVTHRHNMRNIHILTKSSRYCGVYWSSAANKWQAYIYLNGKSIYLGVYSRQEDAYEARLSAEQTLIQ